MNDLISSFFNRITFGLYTPYCRRAKADISSKNFEKADLLFYTCANQKYFEFAILYPLFVLQRNPEAVVEIGICNLKKFKKKYAHLIDFYNKAYPKKILFSSIYAGNILPNSIRFLTQPHLKSRYVYIGDVDILILENILASHLDNIAKHNLDFSNICRPGTRKLSGLHFIEYDKMYPVKIPFGINLHKKNDEDLLYLLMKNKGLRIPDEQKCTYRPTHGLHVSYFSRPPLPTLTTLDNKAAYPAWYSYNDNDSLGVAEKYIELRYSEPVKEFMAQIREQDINLRRIIQFVDISADYIVRHSNKKSGI